MPELRHRRYRVVLHVQEPIHLSEYDDLKSEAWRMNALKVRDQIAAADTIASSKIRKVTVESESYLCCEWCGQEIDAKAEEPCCELASESWVTLGIAPADPELGITPADVVKAALAKLGDEE